MEAWIDVRIGQTDSEKKRRAMIRARGQEHAVELEANDPRLDEDGGRLQVSVCSMSWPHAIIELPGDAVTGDRQLQYHVERLTMI